MNLKAIKERCDLYKAIKAEPRDEQRKRYFDEWWGPEDMIDAMMQAVETDVPELLRWVERAAKVMKEYQEICGGICDEGPDNEGWQSDEKLKAQSEIDTLLAELTDAGEG